MKQSLKVSSIPFSKVSEIISAATKNNWHDTIHMAGGEPQFLPAENVRECLKYFSDRELYKYTDFVGHLRLRDLIVDKLKKKNGINDATSDNIIVLPGGSSCLFTTISSVIDPGDEVILTDPCWEHYRSIVHLIGGCYSLWEINKHSDWNENIKSLSNMITDKTKCVIINTPLNPNGKLFNGKELKDIVDLCDRAGIYLICDEEYEDFVYFNCSHISPRRYSNNVISLYSLSKGHGVTGIRMGYVVAPLNIIDNIKKVSLYTHMYPGSLAQCFAIKLLEKNTEVHFEKVRNDYEEKIQLFYDGIKDIPGVKVSKPSAGVYIFPELPSAGGINAAHRLINEFHLLCVPGDIAGKTTKNHVRFFIGVRKEDIKEACERIALYCEKYYVNE